MSVNKKTNYRSRKVEGVGVMNDEDLKLEEIEVSHTLGGEGEVERV